MEDDDQVHDSPEQWVNDHIRSYVETDGQKGHTHYGKPTLLLTTRGRKSGLLRRTALIYGKDGDNYVIVGSNGGQAKHPGWYFNLVENPEVEVQVAAEKFSARASVATGEEKVRLWSLMAKIFPTYDRYQAKTRREIPVVVLTPQP
jgi:deazaflavin-dependent oxidoreductase (nitroreductase family)